MAFVQIVEFDTEQLEKVQKIGEEWEKATEGKRLVNRRVLCKDRDRPDHYLNIVFFNSYEDAMRNSSLPETEGFAQRMAEVTSGPAAFHNLEVLEDKSY